MSGTTNEENLVDLVFVGLGVDSAAEEVLVKLFEMRTGEGGAEVDTHEEGVELDGGLVGGGDEMLGTLASSAETAESTRVAGHVWKG